MIIGIKTAGWSTRRVAGQVNRFEKTTRREDRRIVRQALVDPTVTRSTIRADVGVAIVPQTISRHLAEANLKSKRPFRALSLTPENRQLRLQWCQVRSMWNVTDWQKVVFSDEFRFVLGTEDNRVRVWRRSGAIFQQDNARLHTARFALDFLRHFQNLPWPAHSPDLSPVEHVWDQLKRQMPSCHFVHDLELAVQDLWAHLPQENIRCLINSMPDRVALWDSRDQKSHYMQDKWSSRNLKSSKRNVPNDSLVKPNDILPPPLHIKLQLVMNFMKSMNKDG
ncbi:transposable element Tcb1 transposase [Trichonephila clavipes]|nr:transposable element Tcb1 transposase [Trichonephila clavipes]